MKKPEEPTSSLPKIYSNLKSFAASIAYPFFYGDDRCECPNSISLLFSVLLRNFQLEEDIDSVTEKPTTKLQTKFETRGRKFSVYIDIVK